MYNLNNFSFGYSAEQQLFTKQNLTISRNQITLLGGANGSGKTTLLRIISGLQKKYEGEILLAEQNLKELSAAEIAEYIIYLKQEPLANIVAATALEDLHIWLHKYAAPQHNDQIIRDSLQYFGLHQLADTPVWKLSGGQAKRVGLAALLLNQHKFWLLDEPTAGLDSKLQAKLIDKLCKRKQQNLGALIISHRVDLFRDVADRIYTIDEANIL
ncbi:MAG: ABC transporter ATP-binding protein [Candidatus Cloacimonadales bacterium]